MFLLLDVPSAIIASPNDLYHFYYKLACLFVGAFFCFLGYLLFVKGIFTDAGELDGKFGDQHIVLKKAAPGTFFALFGCVIVSVTVGQGFIETTYTEETGPKSASVTKNTANTNPPDTTVISLPKDPIK